MLHAKVDASSSLASAASGNGRAKVDKEATSDSSPTPGGDSNGSKEVSIPRTDSPEHTDQRQGDRWEPMPPKVLMDDPKAVPLELRSQIQLYATNE